MAFEVDAVANETILVVNDGIWSAMGMLGNPSHLDGLLWAKEGGWG